MLAAEDQHQQLRDDLAFIAGQECLATSLFRDLHEFRQTLALAASYRADKTVVIGFEIRGEFEARLQLIHVRRRIAEEQDYFVSLRFEHVFLKRPA